MSKRSLIVMAVALLVIFSAVPAFARGGKTGIAMGESNPYELGEDMTFEIWNTRTDAPWVEVHCYQGTERVYFEARGMWDSYSLGSVFTLGPTRAWTEGDADCTAEVGHFRNGRFKAEAHIDFHVYG